MSTGSTGTFWCMPLLAVATAQFFINVQDNVSLDQPTSRDGQGYAVFAKVVSGNDVVDLIERVKTGSKGGHGDVPLDDVLIVRAARVA